MKKERLIKLVTINTIDPEDKIAKLKEMEALLNQRKKNMRLLKIYLIKDLDLKSNLVNQEQTLESPSTLRKSQVKLNTKICTF